MKKRLISILMMAMMVLSYGGIAAFAEVEGDQNAEQPAVTEEAPAEEVTEEEPAPPAEGEDVQTPEEGTTTEPEEVTEPEEGEEEIIDEEEVEGQEAVEAGISNLTVTANKSAGYDVAWDAYEPEVAEGEEPASIVYKVYADGALQAEDLTEPAYSLAGLSLGMHTVKVEAWEVDGTSALASASKSFTWEDLIPEVIAIKACSGYNSVTVRWPQIEGYTHYKIYRKIGRNGTYSLFKDAKAGDLKTYVDIPGRKYYTWRDATANGKLINYYYKVYPVRDKDGKMAADSAESNGNGKVRSISYFVTTKTAKTLTSHDGKNKKLSLPKGKRIECSGFGGGKYTFYYIIGGKEYYFYINAISTKNASASYTKKMNYTVEEAENYINERGIASSTKYLVWASLYTQHTYVFKGSKGKWKVVKHFECASGAANKPSPSGSWKEIHKKIKTRHSRPFWSCYSDINAFHCVKNAGKKNEQGVGYPASNGCIRCKKPNAQFIYNTCPMHTRVVVC